jgi:aminopeptidase N
LLGLSLAACQLPQAPAVSDPEEATTEHESDRGFDVQSYGLDFEIRSDRVGFRGTTRVRLVATRNLNEIVLDAADMQIFKVGTESSSFTLGVFDYDQQLLRIPVAPAIGVGESITLDIDYHAAGLAGMHFVLPSESGVDHIPHVFTQGEALRARFWFPCNDTPDDRASHTLRARVPRTWVTVAAGELVGHEVDAVHGTVLDTWILDQEMPPYLFTFAAGPFVKVEDSWAGMPLWFVGEPQDVNMLRASFEETAEILAFFSDYTGFDYPFAKYAQVAVRDFPFGGMENVTATTVTRNALHPAAYQQARPSWGLVAHEAAHQWFGDIVTCNSWPEAWLNEGFASYFNLLYRRERNGEQDFQQAMGQTIDGYLNACRGANLRPLVKHDYRLPMDLFFDGTIYPGGAARLNLLRGVLGEQVFRAGIKLYLHKHAFQSVTSEDLRIAFEEASGRDLKLLFDQWVYQPGYPELELAWKQQDNMLQVQVAQVQSTAGGVPAAFHFPLDVHWQEQGVWRHERFEVTSEDHVFEVPTGGSFDGWIEFDPQAYLPARLNIHEPAEATALRAAKGWSARSRVLAVRELADYTDDQTTELLWNIARSDSVVGLRSECIGILARRSGGNPAFLTRFRAAYEAERNAVVKLAWWRQICRFADTEVIHFLLRERLQSEVAPTGERVAALRGLAKGMTPQQKFDFASAWIQTPGEGGRLRSAALAMVINAGKTDLHAALGQATFQILLPLSWRGNESPLRIQALNGLTAWLAEVPAESQTAVQLSLLDTYRNALLVPSATLRRAAVGAIRGHHAFFTKEVEELFRREPDARTRRLLEEGQ